MNVPVPTPPRPAPPGPRETFQAFARSDSREGLMDAMRGQAEAYFGCKVELCQSSAQPATGGARPVTRPATQYQGSSFWVARP